MTGSPNNDERRSTNPQPIISISSVGLSLDKLLLFQILKKMKALKISKTLAFACILFIGQNAKGQRNDPDFGKLAGSIDSIVSEAEKRGFSGTVMLKKNDNDVLVYKGYGFADCDQKIKTKREMIYDIGSITKAVTAVAILRLVQNGKLTLDDKIEKFYQGWPVDKRNITILQLLTHGSGLDDIIVGADEDTSISKQQYLEKIRTSKLLFLPGDKTEYSNAGYTLLGFVIEKVSGLPYENFLKRELFDPVKIKKMGYQVPKWKKEEIVCGLKDKEVWGSTKDYFAVGGPSPYLFANGGILANASELSHFFESLVKREILPKELTELILDKVCRKTKGGNTLFYFSGSNLIFTSSYSRWMDSGMSLVLFTSNSKYPRETIESQLLNLIDNFVSSERK